MVQYGRPTCHILVFSLVFIRKQIKYFLPCPLPPHSMFFTLHVLLVFFPCLLSYPSSPFHISCKYQALVLWYLANVHTIHLDVSLLSVYYFKYCCCCFEHHNFLFFSKTWLAILSILSFPIMPVLTGSQINTTSLPCFLFLSG